MMYVFYKLGSSWRIYRTEPYSWLVVRPASEYESRLVHCLNDHIFHVHLDVDTPDCFVERIVHGLNPRILSKLEEITITHDYKVIFHCYD